VKAENMRFEAMTRSDVAALSDLLADGLVYVHSSSVAQTKAELLKDIRDGKSAYRSIEVQDQKAETYGDVGVINGVARFTTAGGAREARFRLRYTDVYLWREGHWRMVAWHCTRMPD
jgi:hypothetical protein